MKIFTLARPLHLLAPMLLLSGGCQLMRAHDANTNDYCAVPLRFDDAVGPPPAPADTAALPQLSAPSQQLARAYGFQTALWRLVRRPATGQGPGSAGYQTFGQQRQALVLRLAQALDDTERVVEELECEKQRVDQATVQLQDRQTTQTRNFTIGSLLAGAASGTISATVRDPSEANLNLVLTVTTAAISAGLGVATLLVNPVRNYPVPNNLLADIWYQRPRPTFYPAGLWAALGQVRSNRKDAGAQSPRQTIQERWTKYDKLKGNQQAEQLYFGTGGAYHIDDLRTRSAMLLQTSLAVRVVAQDLQKLQVEVTSLTPQ